MTRGKILGRGGTADTVPTVALMPDLLRIDVVNVHDRHDPHPGGIGVQLRLAPRGRPSTGPRSNCRDLWRSRFVMLEGRW
jgi:hypothetical protein